MILYTYNISIDDLILNLVKPLFRTLLTLGFEIKIRQNEPIKCLQI